MPGLKVATFNINNVNKRLEPLLLWLDRAAPDVVCLQETKSEDPNFPVRALRDKGYQGIFHGERSWNGVAILARGAAPIETRRGLPGDPSDKQCRYLEAAVRGVLVGCLYLPNGNPQPGPKFRYKLAWFERLRAHAAALRATGHPVVLAGDYNVVPTDLDIYNPRSSTYARNALLQPEPRAAYQQLLSEGWLDALRELHPSTPLFTFWDYLRNARSRNAGLRLDHLLLSESLAPRLDEGGVDTWVRDLPDASDHAPAWITLREDGGG